jgi:hypothetical protein
LWQFQGIGKCSWNIGTLSGYLGPSSTEKSLKKVFNLFQYPEIFFVFRMK